MYEPFYIGKGKNGRCYSFVNHGAYCNNKLKKILKINLKPVVVILVSELTEHEAFSFEKKLIDDIGRIDLKKGPLCNLTNGEEGISNPSQETRKKISEVHKNKKFSDDHRKKLSENHANFKGESHLMFGKQHSVETLRKLSESHKGKKLSTETKEKLSKAFKGREVFVSTKQKLSNANSGINGT